MENERGEESRKGFLDHAVRNHEKRQAPVGFEGMNFEQKRQPYGEGQQAGRDSGDRGLDFLNEREGS